MVLWMWFMNDVKSWILLNWYAMRADLQFINGKDAQ
jgi:hypothetical protein